MQFPKVEVSAVAIVRDGRILAVYNSAWGAFTLPMTKRREWQDSKVQGKKLEEPWEHAASRAVAEVIGKSVVGMQRLPSQPPGLTQSDRTGEIKDYQAATFRYDLSPGVEPKADVIDEWLTLEEWLDPKRMPISPTAVHILKHAEAEAKLAGRAFP